MYRLRVSAQVSECSIRFSNPFFRSFFFKNHSFGIRMPLMPPRPQDFLRSRERGIHIAADILDAKLLDDTGPRHGKQRLRMWSAKDKVLSFLTQLLHQVFQ